MMPARIGGHQRVDVGFDQRARVELLVAQALAEPLLLRFDLLARGVVGADQQVADDRVLRVAQRGDRNDRREAAAILADVGQLVDVLDAARGLENQGLEARRDRRAELGAQRLGARDHFLRIGDVGRRDLVHHLGGRVAQHALRADVEDLDDALRVGGDAREIGAVENRVLQGPRLQQRLLRLLARADVAQDAGEVALAAEPHFADRYLQREPAAILAPAHDLAPEADGARLVARAVVLEGAVALIPIELGNQPAEVLADELRGGIAEHLLRGRVCRLDDAAAGMEGDDAVHHGIEDRLDQRGTVAQGLLRGVFLGDIAKHQHGADHLAVAVVDRRATVGDIALAAIAGNQDGVIGQSLYRALRQRFHDRDGGGQAGFLVDDVEDLVNLAVCLDISRMSSIKSSRTSPLRRIVPKVVRGSPGVRSAPGAGRRSRARP